MNGHKLWYAQHKIEVRCSSVCVAHWEWMRKWPKRRGYRVHTIGIEIVFIAITKRLRWLYLGDTQYSLTPFDLIFPRQFIMSGNESAHSIWNENNHSLIAIRRQRHSYVVGFRNRIYHEYHVRLQSFGEPKKKPKIKYDLSSIYRDFTIQTRLKMMTEAFSVKSCKLLNDLRTHMHFTLKMG